MENSTWYLPNCSRAGAELLLQGLPGGTFLIRPKSDGMHALSIVCNYAIYHCLIYKNDENRFGFGTAEPYQLFNSLSEMVFYYTSHELCAVLPTELRHPINSNLIMLMRHFIPPTDI